MDSVHQGHQSNDFSNGTSASQIESDIEFKAHVYQQLVDLQPYLSPDSQIAVMIQPGDLDDTDDGDESEEHTTYALSLVATFGDYKLEATGRADNVYEAFGMAKQNMMDQMDEYYNAAIDSAERDAQIDSLIEGKNSLH